MVATFYYYCHSVFIFLVSSGRILIHLRLIRTP